MNSTNSTTSTQDQGVIGVIGTETLVWYDWKKVKPKDDSCVLISIGSRHSDFKGITQSMVFFYRGGKLQPDHDRNFCIADFFYLHIKAWCYLPTI